MNEVLEELAKEHANVRFVKVSHASVCGACCLKEVGPSTGPSPVLNVLWPGRGRRVS